MMNWERDEAMRVQEATEDMIRMRDPTKAAALRARPTVEELQTLLNEPDGPPVTIHPDGSISDAGKPAPHTHRFAEILFSDAARGTDRRCQCGARLWEPAANREPCDRTAIVIDRSINCGWITVANREQLKATLRLALDTEVEAGGPYLNNGWNR